MATDTDKIINPFKEQDIEFAELPSEDTRYGSEVLKNLKEMQVGSGKYAFYSNESGIWLGAKKFASAPFSVDMLGRLKATVGTFSGDIDGASITGSTITGSTLSTADSGQRIELESTLMAFYNSSNVLIAEMYADTESILIKGKTDDTDIFFDAGLNANIVFASDGDIKAVFDSDSSRFYPADNGVIDFGLAVKRWDTIYSQAENTYSITLNSDEITSWSDLESYISVAPTQSQIEDILYDMGASSATTLRVRRVDSGGVDAGWYYLHFTYGVLDEATIN